MMKKLWEMTPSGAKNYSVYVYVNQEDGYSFMGVTNGKPLNWGKTLEIQPFIEKRKKIQKPSPDIGHLTVGSIILNRKAYLALKDLLQKFGEFIEVDCLGEPRYFYNITNLISCVDVQGSEKIESAVVAAKFLQEAIPVDIQVFKDPSTLHHMYLTQAARDEIEKIIAENNLSGLRFVEAGTL